MLKLERSRRGFFIDFARLGLAVGAGTKLAACGPRDLSATKSASTAGSTSSSASQINADAGPSPTDGGTASHELAALAKTLDGSIVQRGDAGYDVARRLFNTRFDDVLPRAVVYCASPSDVRNALAWARAHGVPITPRNGGHSYAGYSTCPGLVLDVTRMRGVAVDAAAKTIGVGSGALLIDVYAALEGTGLAISGGSCPTVGITGLTLGGGIGPLSRSFGLTADSLLEVEIVVASGDVLVCNATQNADLFWACRGGGGGNFGIVTQLTFRTHTVSAMTYFELNWPIDGAHAIVDAWQAFGPSAPDALFSICGLFAGSLNAGKKDPAFASLYGLYLGTAADLDKLLAPMLSTTAGPPSDRRVHTDAFLPTMLKFGGCEGRSVAQCRPATVGGVGVLQRETFKAGSDFALSALSPAAIDVMIRWVTKRQSDPLLFDGGVMMDAHGGAIARVPKNATAYFHRDALFSCQYLAPWQSTDAAATADANIAWLRAFRGEMRPYVSGYAYQNYIDPDLLDWKHAYYGDNYPRLVEVKRRYDPGSVFSFAQGIPTSG